MKIHLNQIPSGGTLHIEGEEDRDILDLHDALARPLGPVRYSLDAGLSGSGLFATGTLAVDLELECVRCLTRFAYTIEVPDFAVQIELPPTETVDLTDEIREDILLALPPHPHCDWNGATTCAGVLEIKRIQEPEPASEPEEANPWTTLDLLPKPKDH
ncbi:MAG: hypothetical protein WCH57_10490 [Verrucomicrobiota bacterium]